MDYKNGFWYTYDDASAGGSSRAIPAPDAVFKFMGKGFLDTPCARLCGTVTDKFEYGFIGMGYYLSPVTLKTSFDLSDKKGIRFMCKGDGRDYRVKIVSTHPGFVNRDSDNQYGYNFRAEAEWAQYELQFMHFAPEPGWGSEVEFEKAVTKIKELQFVTLGRPHATIELLIDKLEIF